MMQISYPASRRGVEMARMPSGAVASMLEKEATKNTIFFDDFTAVPFVVVTSRSKSKSESKSYQRVARYLSQNCQNSAKLNRPETGCSGVLDSLFQAHEAFFAGSESPVQEVEVVCTYARFRHLQRGISQRYRSQPRT